MRRSSRVEARRSGPAVNLAWLLPALAALLAILVQRRALGAFFSTDDLRRLEEAAGLVPATPTVWRLVSEVLYVRLMLAVFGPHPLPFHIVSMALHLANVVFVHRTGRKAGLPAAAAFLAATVFGVFPLFYTVLPSAVNINDIMALTFVFIALLALEAPTPGRIVAGVACYAIALLSKEAVVFVPFAAVLLPAPGERLQGATRRLAPLLAVGASFGGLYLAFRNHGLGTGGPAYAMGFGVNLFHNLMTYARWCVDMVHMPGGGTPDPQAWRVGVWPVVAFALAAAFSPTRRAVIRFGAAWWLLGLVPVLPLLAHSYGHYLYVPMVGFSLAAAGALDAGFAAAALLLRRLRTKDASRAPADPGRPRAVGVRESRASRRPAAAAVSFIVLALAFAARSESLIHARVAPRLGTSQFALDPFTRKMEIAQRSVASVVGQVDRSHDSLVVFMPPGFGRVVSSSTGELVGPPPGEQYDVVATVLGGGRALRLFEPRIDSVAFVNRWAPDYRNFALYTEGAGGQLTSLGRGPHSHAQFASALLDAGYVEQGRDYLVALVQAYPHDRMVRLLFAAALAQTGDPRGAGVQARLVLEGAPPDSIGAMARRLIVRVEGAK